MDKLSSYITFGAVFAPGDKVVIDHGTCYVPELNENATHEVVSMDRVIRDDLDGKYWTVAICKPIEGEP